MNECIGILQKMPAYKNKVWDKISAMHNEYEEEKGMQGLRAGEEARKRLRDKLKGQDEAEAAGLDGLIETTAKISALQAINLSQLLKKKWSEEKNAYFIMSNIKTEK